MLLGVGVSLARLFLYFVGAAFSLQMCVLPRPAKISLAFFAAGRGFSCGSLLCAPPPAYVSKGPQAGH